MNRIGRSLTGVGLAALLLLAAAVIGIRLSGIRTYIVLSGSMAPTIPVGSLAITQPVQPSTIRAGDIITFELPDRVVTHRVAAIEQSDSGPLFTTKGDANEVADLQKIQLPSAVGIVRADVPLAGYLIAYLQAYWRVFAQLVSAAVLLAAAALLLLLGKSESRPRPAARGRGLAPTRLGVPSRLAALRASLRVEVADEAWSAHVSWLRRAPEAA